MTIKKIDVLPKEIDLLFDNKKLDILKYLYILYLAKTKLKKKKLNLDQLLYYYTLLSFETSYTSTPKIYKYLRDKKRINEAIIYLENLKLIQVYGEVYIKLSNLKISISKSGIELINFGTTESFEAYISHISNIMDKYPYGTKVQQFQNLLHKGEFK